MRWPWVSRWESELWERSSNGWSQQAHALIDSVQRAEDRYDALLDKYHALKLQGATVIEPRRPVEAKEPDAVQWAINEKAGSNPALRFHLTRYAAKQRGSHVGDSAIIDAITNWRREGDDD